MKIFLLLPLLIQFLFSSAQKVFVEKRDQHERTSISIAIKLPDTIRYYGVNCGFEDVAILPDSAKIKLMNELLSFLSDTSECYIPVYNLTNHYMGKKFPVSKKFNVQVEALVYITYLGLSSRAFVYCPFPVLYDKEEKKEITKFSPELDEIIRFYRTWVKEITKKGFFNYSLPLHGTRYEWFGSLMDNLTFEKYPLWEKYYDCPAVD
jgi:hypothetical protein